MPQLQLSKRTRKVNAQLSEVISYTTTCHIAIHLLKTKLQFTFTQFLQKWKKSILLMFSSRYSWIVYISTVLSTVSGKTLILPAIKFKLKHFVFQLLQRPLSWSRHLQVVLTWTFLKLPLNIIVPCCFWCLGQGVTNTSLICRWNFCLVHQHAIIWIIFFS